MLDTLLLCLTLVAIWGSVVAIGLAFLWRQLFEMHEAKKPGGRADRKYK
jgi:hypothetical protein